MTTPQVTASDILGFLKALCAALQAEPNLSVGYEAVYAEFVEKLPPDMPYTKCSTPTKSNPSATLTGSASGESIQSKVDRLNALFMEVQTYKRNNPQAKLAYYPDHWGSKLNAYREGDLGFQEFVADIEQAVAAGRASVQGVATDHATLIEGIQKDIADIGCIYRTVGDAMYDEPRDRLAQRIATRVLGQRPIALALAAERASVQRVAGGVDCYQSRSAGGSADWCPGDNQDNPTPDLRGALRECQSSLVQIKNSVDREFFERCGGNAALTRARRELGGGT